MNAPTPEQDQSTRLTRLEAVLLFLCAYGGSVFALMCLFIIVLGFGDPKFRAPDIYFAIHSLFFSPAAIFSAFVLAARSDQAAQLRFGAAALASILVCDTFLILIDHWLVLLPSYAALSGAYLYHRRAPKRTKVA